MKNKNLFAHMLAILTILIWGTTYISTKILLKDFSPEEILGYRFFTAFFIILIIYPKKLEVLSIKEEILFFLLGATGISLYYWTENLALQYTYASNVGLIASAIPIITVLISNFVFNNEKLTMNMFIGFIIAIIGVAVIIYNGKVLKLNPKGDIMAIISAVLFSIYSILIKKINSSYSQLFIVRKTFFYGILTMLPIFLVSNVTLLKKPVLNISIIFNFLFLAAFASVLCFLMWNKAIKIIGAIKTTNYIYFVPLITMVSSSIVLKEQISFLMILGGILIFAGVYINQSKWFYNKLKISIIFIWGQREVE